MGSSDERKSPASSDTAVGEKTVTRYEICTLLAFIIVMVTFIQLFANSITLFPQIITTSSTQNVSPYTLETNDNESTHINITNININHLSTTAFAKKDSIEKLNEMEEKHLKGHQNKYLSYELYAKSKDSQFTFIEINKQYKLYHIITKYPNIRKEDWLAMLTYHQNIEFEGHELKINNKYIAKGEEHTVDIETRSYRYINIWTNLLLGLTFNFIKMSNQLILYSLLSMITQIHSECLYYTWNDTSMLQQKLQPTDSVNGENYFGFAVSIFNDVIAVGAELYDNPADSGAVYIYRYNTTNKQWDEEQKIKPPDAATSDTFGGSVSVSNNVFISGSTLDGADSGSAYIYRYNELSQEKWNFEQKLTASDAANTDHFGVSVSILNDIIIVGARYDDNPTNSGAAYIYRYNNLTQQWNETQKLKASGASSSARFGESVSISNDVIVVGSFSFGAYTFRYNNLTQEWDQEQILKPSGTVIADHYGASVSILNDVIVIGSPYDDDDVKTDSGAAYVFRYNKITRQWDEKQKLKASDAAASDVFGWSVSISNDIIVVGSYLANNPTDSGATYIYTYNEQTQQWDEEIKLKASDAAASDVFGWSVSISNDIIVVGSYLANNPTDSGATYIYTYNEQTQQWDEEIKLKASDAAASDIFGGAVSISNGIVVVGAYGDAGTSVDTGAAYVFPAKCYTENPTAYPTENPTNPTNTPT
eukprot:451918_1